MVEGVFSDIRSGALVVLAVVLVLMFMLLAVIALWSRSRPAASGAGGVLPWHRQPWPWLFIALPAIAVVGGITTFVLAQKSFDGFVAKDYDKEGLTIVKQNAPEERAREMGLSAMASVRDGSVSVRLDAAREQETPDTLYLSIVHRGREALDQHVVLQKGPDGAYAAPIAPLNVGQWRFVLANAPMDDGKSKSDESRNWRMNGTANLPTETEVSIRPSDSQTVEGGVSP